MKALTLEVNRSTWAQTTGYELREIVEPQLSDPSKDQAIIEPIFAGVCGTDKGIWFRKAFKESILSHLEKDHRKFYVMGHEMLGRIVEIAPNPRNLKVGDIISAESHIYCGHCPMCLQGNQHVCANERIIGVNWDGVFAEKIKLPINVLWPTQLEKIRAEVAAIQEPFGNAVHVCTPNMLGSDLTKAEMRGKNIAIFGCGTIGMFAVMIAKAMGAKKIIGIEPNPINREKALACGADHVISPSEDSAKEIQDYFFSYGADYCLEMSGFPSSVIQAVRSAARGGHIVLFGLSSGDLMIPQFEEVITSGKRLHAVVGRRVFSTWEITKKLLEDRTNGIQEMVWKVILESGKGTILPLQEFTKEKMEAALLRHPKLLIEINKI